MKLVKIKEIKSVRNILARESYYDQTWFEQFSLVARWVNSLVNEDSRLLEVGCGNGILRQSLICSYFGIDPIRHDDIGPDIDFAIAVGEHIPCQAGAFDFILVKDAINYFSDLEVFLIEIRRALSVSGSLLVTEFVGKSYHPAKQKLKNFIKRHLGLSFNVWNKTYLNYCTSHDVIWMAEKLGFKTSYCYVREDCRYYLVIRNK